MDVNFDPAPVTPVSPVSPVPPIGPAAPRQTPLPSGQDPAQDPGQNPSQPDPPAHRPPHEAVARLQDHVQALHRELHFQIDQASGRTVVRVVDAETGTLIRQLPSQDALALLQALQAQQSGSGLLLREQA